MTLAGMALTLLGLIGSLLGAAWLYWGIDPNDEKFQDDGLLYPGKQVSRVLPRFIKAQQRPTTLVVVGGGLQVAGGTLALLGYSL